MGIHRYELTRPDDLLALEAVTDNLLLDTSQPEQPVLVVDDSTRPALLTLIFPPQTIAETAYFEASIIAPDTPPDVPPPPPTPVQAVPPPGQVKARIGHRSRLVFKVPPGYRIPFSIEGLLDWSAFDLVVNPIAAIPPNPTAAQIAAAPAIARPADNETFLELPYRLFISPNAAVRWGHRLEAFGAHGRTELWHTRLQHRTAGGAAELSRSAPAPLRVLWSEDYNPLAPPDPTLPDPDLGLAAMSPRDRHELVILTSAFHGYIVDRTIGGFLQPGLLGVDTRVRRFPGISFTEPHVPQPFFAEELMLSSLGAWLRSRGNWTPPHTPTPRQRFAFERFEDLSQRLLSRSVQAPARAPRYNLFDEFVVDDDRIFLPGLVPAQDTLELSEWVHLAAQGRDHYVRIVYEGELWPFRNKAALVKVTERKFREGPGGVVMATLFQRMFVVVREPETAFAMTDRGMLLKRVRLTTLVTPDIALPEYLTGASRSFWVEVMTGTVPPRARFKFHAVGTDSGGNPVDFTIPMMFVSNNAQGALRTNAAAHYNKTESKAELENRSAHVPGQKVLFAEKDAAAFTDNTRLVARTLNFVMVGSGAGPRLLEAEVDIPQVQELLGTTAATSIRPFPGFVAQGLDGGTGVFAEVIKEDFTLFSPAKDPFAVLVPHTLGVGFSSDQAGGFATPDLSVSVLSRKLGPLAGTAPNATLDNFDPATFFKGGVAKLFGSFSLDKLLRPLTTLEQNAPKLRTRSQDIPGGKLLTATLDWEPAIQNVDLIVAAFEKDRGGTTQLKVHGVVERRLTFPAAGAPLADTTFQFKGVLNDFRVTVLKAVAINFREFGFESRGKAKTDVTVKLDSAAPVTFTGDLEFVEELRKAIPPDLFGDGPSLDVTDKGIRAGFAFALPPIAVGVFALKDVALGAALTLPFLDGKPTFDFNVSERPRPFLLAVGIFGGGGFFRLQLDTAGIRVVEAALEFGATASIDLGVASGGVHIMAGIYFKLERKKDSTDLAPLLSGYLRMGGHLSVLGLIKVSLEFCLSFTYDSDKEKAFGRATLTVKVEIVFFSTSVEITVERAFGGTSGDPNFGQLFPAPTVWAEYALAFA